MILLTTPFLTIQSVTIDHFTVVCSATWPVDGSEVRVDLVLIQTSLLLSCKCTLLKSEQLVLHNKRSEVCIKTRSTLASLPSKGQVTKQTTVKWSITLYPPSPSPTESGFYLLGEFPLQEAFLLCLQLKYVELAFVLIFLKFCSLQFTVYKYLWRSWFIFKGTL